MKYGRVSGALSGAVTANVSAIGSFVAARPGVGALRRRRSSRARAANAIVGERHRDRAAIREQRLDLERLPGDDRRHRRRRRERRQTVRTGRPTRRLRDGGERDPQRRGDRVLDLRLFHAQHVDDVGVGRAASPRLRVAASARASAGAAADGSFIVNAVAAVATSRSTCASSALSPAGAGFRKTLIDPGDGRVDAVEEARFLRRRRDDAVERACSTKRMVPGAR